MEVSRTAEWCGIVPVNRKRLYRHNVDANAFASRNSFPWLFAGTATLLFGLPLRVGQTLTPVVRSLLIICVAVFGLQWWLSPRIEYTFAMWNPDTPYFHVWQILTANFLHSDWIHLLVNCMVLYSFGPPMEQLLGPRRFAAFFLVAIACLPVIVRTVRAALPQNSRDKQYTTAP